MPAGRINIYNGTQLLRLDHSRLVLLGSIRLHKALLADDPLVCHINDVLIRDGGVPHRLGLPAHHTLKLGCTWRSIRPQPHFHYQLLSPGDLY